MSTVKPGYDYTGQDGSLEDEEWHEYYEADKALDMMQEAVTLFDLRERSRVLSEVVEYIYNCGPMDPTEPDYIPVPCEVVTFISDLTFDAIAENGKLYRYEYSYESGGGITEPPWHEPSVTCKAI